MDFEDNNPLSANAEESHFFDGIKELQESQIITGGLVGSANSDPDVSVHQKRGSASPEGKIAIVDAGKSREGPQRGHIVYTIRLSSGVRVRRRYSEFESLRRVLRRVFPTVVMPPIPEKHSISAYATNPTHAHEDSKVIEHRRRMLAAFLNRCQDIASLRDCWLLERFLDPNASWNEVLASDTVLHLPKSILQAPPLDPAHPTPAHAYLPIPPSGARLAAQAKLSSNKDAGVIAASSASETFKKAEANAKEYEQAIGNGLEKSVRRATKHYSQLAADCADLGGQFNAFSLDSHVSVTNGIEKVGQAVDTGYISTGMLIDQLSVVFTEPLAESVQLAATARQVLKYRRLRALQVDMTADSLAAKRRALAELEKAESEAQRISSFLNADERISEAVSHMSVQPTQSNGSVESEDPKSASMLVTNDAGDEEDVRSLLSIDTIDEPSRDTEEPLPVTQSPSNNGNTNGTGNGHGNGNAPSVTTGRRFRLPGLSQLNHAIHGMMDVDPEASRRGNITRTQEQIAHLEGALEVAKEDSQAASAAVEQELTRYTAAKEADIKHLVESFVRCHIEWAEKNLESWLEARQALAD